MNMRIKMNSFLSKNKYMILISNKQRSSIKIGQGWRLFCSENKLKEGDIVVFQADNDFIESNVEVFVNGCCCD